MKRALVVLIFALVIATMTWGIWAGHEASIRAEMAGNKPVNPIPAPVKLVMSKNWQEFRAARVTTFKHNPDLAAGHRQLFEDMDDLGKEMDVDIIKVDPKVAPFLVWQGSTGAPLTAAESQELQFARQKALKANPDLGTKSVQLSKEMLLFQSKFSAAMLKTDPNVAPMLAGLGPEHQVPRLSSPPLNPQYVR